MRKRDFGSILLRKKRIVYIFIVFLNTFSFSCNFLSGFWNHFCSFLVHQHIIDGKSLIARESASYVETSDGAEGYLKCCGLKVQKMWDYYSGSGKPPEAYWSVDSRYCYKEIHTTRELQKDSKNRRYSDYGGSEFDDMFCWGWILTHMSKNSTWSNISLGRKDNMYSIVTVWKDM